MNAPHLRSPAPADRRVPTGYRFAPRRCRRRVAQLLATGRDPLEAARIARVDVTEIAALLADADFARLVAHYHALAALPRDERIARLADLALEILELGLEAGDLRIAMFVLYERLRGRDPSHAIAWRLVERLERLAAQAGLSDTPRTEATVVPEAAALPEVTANRPSASSPPARAPHAAEARSADLAARHSDSEAAERRAADLLRRTVPALPGRMVSILAERVSAEAERVATGEGDGIEADGPAQAGRVARHLRATCPPAIASAADLRLHVRQKACAFGRANVLLPEVASAA